MSVEENKALIRRFVEEGWTKEGLDILDEFVAADVVWHPGNNSGLEPYKQMFAEWHTGFPDARFVIEDIIAEGDKVVVRHSFSGTHTGEWFGIPPTNKQVSFGGTVTVRIADGEIVEQWGHWGGFWFHVQLGTIPSFEEIVKQAKSRQV